MAKIINRKQLLSLSDEEIIRFFEETTFEGIFSTEIKSNKHPERYIGSISSIKFNGRPTNILYQFLNVPQRSNKIKEGLCSFKCRFDIDAYRADSSYYVNVIGSSLEQIETLIDIDYKSTKEEDLFEFWGVTSREFIGFYHFDKESQVFVVDDIRKSNFDYIPYYPGDDKEKRPIVISRASEIKGINLNEFYLFNWRLTHRNKINPYEISIDFTTQPQPIKPKWFINKLFDDRYRDTSKNFASATSFLDTLSKQLSAKDSTFVYELLQNANDYPVEGKLVDVEFHITDNYLLFMHSGDKFNVRNISGICGINEKEKVANKKTIGYKGIGFKTVFLNNHYVYLKTGMYSFRFEEKAEKIKRLGAPWPILPIWTEHKDVDAEVNNVFDHADKKFQVQIALRPENKALLRSGTNNYSDLFREVFEDSNIILFIPNINSVRLVIDDNQERMCYRNNDEWVVGDYIEDIPYELQESINKTLEKGNTRIPEKYMNFDCTKVSFACKHKGNMIEPIVSAKIYCYLPTDVSWGFPFLMNTDMLPAGDRNSIVKEVNLIDGNGTNFNEELAAIAGRKLFDWILDLMKSRKYDLGSVFALIPDFKTCKKEHYLYDDFIARFGDEFDSCVDKKEIVPVKGGFALAKDVVCDETGLSSSGIMTDDEFLKFAGLEQYYLPLSVIRTDENFNKFLKRYIGANVKFKKDDLKKLVSNEFFREWLKVQENNNKFLQFLLEKKYLVDFSEKKIFLNERGELFNAEHIFFDVDEHLDDLEAFKDKLDYLSHKTREYFADNKDWEQAINDIEFNEFDCDDFVDDVLLSKKNLDETKTRLKDKNTSIHFYKFLAENVRFGDFYLDLPFINDSDVAVDSFSESILFVSSDEGHAVSNAEWLSKVDIEFLSPEYSKESIKYFKENFGLKDFSHKYIAEHVILHDENDKVNYHNSIAEALQGTEGDISASKAFIIYCFAHKDYFKQYSLWDYALNVCDGNGDSKLVLSQEEYIYFPSIQYDEFSSKEWIKDDWMFALNEGYYRGVENPEELRKFITKTFDVKNLDNKCFYRDIVKGKIDDILPLISGKEDPDGKRNFDFFHYLDDNFDLIFKEEKDDDKFDKYVIVSSKQDDGLYDLAIKDTTIYFYDNELEDIVSQDWFPSDLISICNKEYGFSRSLTRLGVLEYEFSSFFKDVIIENIDKINEAIETKEASIKFFNFVLEHIDDIPDSQQKELKAVKVYLYGQEDPADESTSPKILSEAASELFNMGLVEFSDLDIIDPDYHPENSRKFWNNLGYGSFTTTDFYQWLSDNSSTFSDTLLDETKNIDFWRWAFRNQNMQYKDDLYNLPMLLKDGSIDSSEDKIYLSDEYVADINIEQFIQEYQQQAKYISPKYIDSPDNIDKWKDFWQNIGVKFELIDFLIKDVIPHLSEHNKEDLPVLIAKNRGDLEKQDENLIDHLDGLMVKAHDGNFYQITDCFLIDSDDDEPFSFIELPNQISSPIDVVSRLFEDIIKKKSKHNLVRDINVWRQLKIDCFLELQNIDEEEFNKELHYQFINELASIKNNNNDDFKALESIADVKLLNREFHLCDASSLTLGSVYHPYFDFEKCGIGSFDYIDNSYAKNCSENVFKLFCDLKVHNDFETSDTYTLTSRECAVYFWQHYLTHPKSGTIRIRKVKKMIDDHLFDNLVCVPTIDGIKSPSDLYYGNDISDYVDHISDKSAKVPLDTLPVLTLENGNSLWSCLPFKVSLSFTDALHALLTINAKKRRKQLLEWMIEEYDENNDSQKTAITEYRENNDAEWFNSKNDRIQIKKLYALDPDLEQNFGTNPQIINKKFLPDAQASYKKACDMLQIKTITKDDLEMDPVGCVRYTTCDSNNQLFALAIAAKINEGKEWKTRYDSYMTNIEPVEFYRCERIRISYKENKDINQSLLKSFYKSDTKGFYFIDSLDNKHVFKSYVPWFMQTLDISDKDISEELVSEIMDSKESAIDIIHEQNEILLDEEFMALLESIVPGSKESLRGKEAVDADEVPPYDETQDDHRKPIEPTEGIPNETIEKEGDADENTQKDNGYEPSIESDGSVQVEQSDEQPDETEDSSGIDSKPINELKEDQTTSDSHDEEPSPIMIDDGDEEDDKLTRENTDVNIDKTPIVKKGDDQGLGKQERTDAQLEAQRFLMQEMPSWEFPEGYGECDEDGIPIHHSISFAIDQNGNTIRFVLKSYKKDNEPFKVNTNEWNEMMSNGSALFIYRGSRKGIVKIEPKDLIRNQSNITITFSTENFDYEQRISDLADALHYFKELHFDFESFNISQRALSIKDIYNKVSGTQKQTTNEDL